MLCASQFTTVSTTPHRLHIEVYCQLAIYGQTHNVVFLIVELRGKWAIFYTHASTKTGPYFKKNGYFKKHSVSEPKEYSLR